MKSILKNSFFLLGFVLSMGVDATNGRVFSTYEVTYKLADLTYTRSLVIDRATKVKGQYEGCDIDTKQKVFATVRGDLLCASLQGSSGGGDSYCFRYPLNQTYNAQAIFTNCTAKIAFGYALTDKCGGFSIPAKVRRLPLLIGACR